MLTRKRIMYIYANIVVGRIDALFALNYNVWLIHCGGVAHICVSKVTTIGSHNGLSADNRQSIILTHAAILLTGIWGKIRWNSNRN